MHLSFSLGSMSFSVGKSLSSAVQAWIQGNDGDYDSGNARLTRPYQQSAWVYTAVSTLADVIANVPFRFSRLGTAKRAASIRAFRDSSDPRQRAQVSRALSETLIESGPIVDLFNSPHPTMPRSLFWELLTSWDALRGEFFIVPLDMSDSPVDLKGRSPQVRRMITLPTDMFRHDVRGYDLIGWRFTGSPQITPIPSVDLSPSEVIHSRNVNPFDYWRGMSPLSVALVSASADYAAEMFHKGLMMNNADTGVIVTTDQNPMPEQRDQILAALKERKRKAGTPDRPLFLWGGAKLEKPSISAVDMEFLANRKFTRQEIFAIFKVPESICGFSEAKSSALSGGGNAMDAEKLTFIDHTIDPKCRRIEAALDPIIKSFGEDLVGWFDVDSLPERREARRMRAETATKFFAMGVPFKDINEQFDLGFPSHPWHEQGFLPFSVQTASSVGAEPPPSETPVEPPAAEPPKNDDDQPETDEEKSNPFVRALDLLKRASQWKAANRGPSPKTLWEKHVAARKKSVKLFDGKVRKVLWEFRSSTLANLANLDLQKQFAEKKSFIDLIFNSAKFGQHLRLALDAPIRSTLELAAKELLDEIGSKDPWSVPPKEVLDYIARRDQSIQGTGNTVRNQLNTTIEEGIKAGESTAQIADRVRATFNRLANGGEEIDVSESMRIAQTEVNLAYNHSRALAMDAAGSEYKGWLSSHGPTVRETHADAEERYVGNPIPISDPFEVGGYLMMYPGDDSMGAPPSEVINCHCIVLAAEKLSEDEKTVRFHIHGLGIMEFKKQ